MKRVIVTAKTLDIEIIKQDAFSNFGQLIEIRNNAGLNSSKFLKCICCDHEFEVDDNVYIAFVKNSGNRLACKKCYDSENPSKED